MPAAAVVERRTPVSRGAWSWLLGGALVAVVVAVGLRFSEARELVRLAREAHPAWLWLALLLQAGTYVAQGEVWRVVARPAGHPLSRGEALELSLAKLFVDQALPSAGLSSSVMVASALDRGGRPRGVTMALVALNIASYNIAYVMGLTLALVLAAVHGQINAAVVWVAAAFALFCVVVTAGVLALVGRHPPAWLAPLTRVAPIRQALAFVEAADRSLTHSPALIARTTAWQLLIIGLDAATLFVLVQSLGASVSIAAVFVSFMVSSLFRTVGVLPGGLGTFEASAVLTLHLTGVPVAVALAATLLFRGLSFVLPMLPGWWCSRRILANATAPTGRESPIPAYWALPIDALYARLESNAAGLSAAEAARRLDAGGGGAIVARRTLSRTRVLARQVRSPLLWLLVFAAVISASTGEWADAIIVFVIIVATVTIGYVREYRAERALDALAARVKTRAIVLRDGVATPVPREAVVPGDVVLLAAGTLVPADAVLIDATDCFVSEAALTGESFPVEKRTGVVDAAAGLSGRLNTVLLGTNVRNGTARALVVATGPRTEFAHIAAHLIARPPETSFDRGVRRFGYFLTTAMLLLTLLVFVAHVLRGRPPVETLLFSVALAVGLSPELLPAILSVNLARGAQTMAGRGVLVRRLTAIENLGSMDVLCTDKTGTLTEGVIQLDGAYDPDGVPSATVLGEAALNAHLQAGLPNALDDAIRAAQAPDPHVAKLAEIPFDFVRKRLSVIVTGADSGAPRLITKGAFDPVMAVCTRLPDGTPLDDDARGRIRDRYDHWSRQGIRVIALAGRPIDPRPSYARDDETDLTLLGFLAFLDRPKEGVIRAIEDLRRLGVAVKIITGDNRLVAQHLASLVGLAADRVLTGRELAALDGPGLWHRAQQTDLFVEVDPGQKEQIIQALRRAGHIVGFLGDGVNDAPAMHVADTSLSVETAVDVCREAADFVLLERDLDVLRGGIEEGRRTFANTLKYILTTMSANLGNMISMALASLALPFLPLTAGQILLNNLLSDVPAVGIADDAVDGEMVERPPRWDIRFIARFMTVFGLVSSLFDVITFVVLIALFHAGVALFQTCWFSESLLTELVVALVVRTRRPFFRSRPGALLLGSTLVMVALTLAIPVVPWAGALGFVPLPLPLVAAIAAIAAIYVAATEGAKRWFYRPAAASR